MLKQIFKIIWKNKGRNKLLMFEFFLSFILLFVIFTAIIWATSNSNLPLGFKYKDVCSIEMIKEDANSKIKINDSIVINYLKTLPDVKDATVQIYSHPFTKSFVNVSSFKYKEKSFKAPFLAGIGRNWSEVFEPKFLEGRAIIESDIYSNECPCYISKQTRKLVFGNEKAVGEVIDIDHMGKFRIIGVIDQFRANGEFTDEKPYFLCFRSDAGKYPYNARNVSMNASLNMHYRMFYVKSNKTNSLAFQDKLFKSLTHRFPSEQTEVYSLSELREQTQDQMIMPFVAISSLLLFLIINVLLGMFGQLWYTINLRKQEIGIRVAVGASKLKIYGQLLGEMWVMCLLGIIPAIILLSQLPILGFWEIKSAVYITALIISSIAIIVLISICSYLPARQATRFEVAEALHEN
jgi:putative ABC transport system permease protein